MKFTVSAPGKIILTGEHAVVYGYKAIAASINLRCYAHVNTKPDFENLVILNLKSIPYVFKFKYSDFIKLRSEIYEFNVGFERITPEYQEVLSRFLDEIIVIKTPDREFIKTGLTVFLDLYFQTVKDFKSLNITISSDFSYGCGIGSSAAYSTVLSVLFLISTGVIKINSDRSLTQTQLEDVNSLALRGEKIVHGTPSGIDNCISTNGKCIVFQRTPNGLVKTFKDVSDMHVILVDTGVKRCTRSVVSLVRKMVEHDEEKYHELFRRIHSISDNLETILSEKSDNTVEFEKLIDENQNILRQIGVSHLAIEHVIQVLHQHNIAAKLTGAGCGGCIYGICSSELRQSHRMTELLQELSELGYAATIASLGCDGVRISEHQLSCD